MTLARHEKVLSPGVGLGPIAVFQNYLVRSMWIRSTKTPMMLVLTLGPKIRLCLRGSPDIGSWDQNLQTFLKAMHIKVSNTHFSVRHNLQF